MKKSLFILFCLVFGISVDAQSFEDANAMYAGKQYSEAYTAYSDLETEWSNSPTYWYNRGNSAYKSGMVAASVWCYEKALKLDPTNDDIAFNLELAHNNVVDKITVSPSNAFSGKVNKWLGMIPSALLVWFNVFCLLIGVVCLLLFRRNRQRIKLRTNGYILLLVYAATLVLSLAKDAISNNINEAVVASGRLSIQAEPNEGASALFILHEGTKVVWNENSNHSDWIEIELSDGRQGWCEKKELLFI